MKNFLFLLFFFISVHSFSQFSNWSGDVEWFSTDASGMIRLDAPKDSSPAQLHYPSSRILNTSWELRLKMRFNPTSSNYLKFYICSDRDDLIGEPEGYFIRIGHTKKNISLHFQKGKTTKMLIDGLEKRLDKPEVSISVKALLDKAGNLTLYSKAEGDTDYTEEGRCRLDVLPQCNYLGVVCIYTATRRNLFFFEHFEMKVLEESDETQIPSGGSQVGTNEAELEPGIEPGTYLIKYNFPNSTNRCRMMIYDISGRLAAMPYNNHEMGAEGFLYWNGAGNSGRSLQRGVYVIYLEINQSDGKVRKYKFPTSVN